MNAQALQVEDQMDDWYWDELDIPVPVATPVLRLENP